MRPKLAYNQFIQTGHLIKSLQKEDKSNGFQISAGTEPRRTNNNKKVRMNVKDL